jgi:hypothetical protein
MTQKQRDIILRDADEKRACVRLRDLYRDFVDEFGEDRARELFKGMAAVMSRRPRGRPKGSRTTLKNAPANNRDTERQRRHRDPFYRIMQMKPDDIPDRT